MGRRNAEKNSSIFDFGPPASPERLAMAGGDCGLFEITSGILDCGLDTFIVREFS